MSFFLNLCFHDLFWIQTERKRGNSGFIVILDVWGRLFIKRMHRCVCARACVSRSEHLLLLLLLSAGVTVRLRQSSARPRLVLQRNFGASHLGGASRGNYWREMD